MEGKGREGKNKTMKQKNKKNHLIIGETFKAFCFHVSSCSFYHRAEGDQ